MFNSLLLTRDYDWLNREVKVFNQIMFDVSNSTRNLSFFDSDNFAAKSYNENLNIPCFYAQGQKGGLTEQTMRNSQSNDGIHISLQMRRLIPLNLSEASAFWQEQLGTGSVSAYGCGTHLIAMHGGAEMALKLPIKLTLIFKLPANYFINQTNQQS